VRRYIIKMAEEYTVQEIFDLIDKDGNGSIDKSELTKGLQAMGCNPTDDEIQALMEEADSKVDPDGKIQYTEFAELVEAHRKSREEERESLAKAFKTFDVNGDGLISKEELRQALTTLGFSKLSDDEVEELFAETDADDNGFIDFNELIQVIMA